MLTESEIAFILRHEKADTARLLLSPGKDRSGRAAPDGSLNLPLCISCIEARRKIAAKVPLWYANPALAYPLSLPVEQCSSQAAALYKQRLAARLTGSLPAADGNHPAESGNAPAAAANASGQTDCTSAPAGNAPVLADLTGGMGIDSFFLSRIARELYYFEQQPLLCQAARYNFERLGAGNIRTCCTTIKAGSAELEELARKKPALIYLDPARRDGTDAKVVRLQDYQPNLLELKDRLLGMTPYVLVKISPMADIRYHLLLLPETEQIHVVAVDNECKEVLFLLAAGRGRGEAGNGNGDGAGSESETGSREAAAGPVLHAVNLSSRSPEPGDSAFSFRMEEEESAAPEYARSIAPGDYLFKPHKALLKAGAFKLVAVRFGLRKLAPSTHLYTCGRPVPDFPGKRFQVKEVRPFNKKELKQLGKDWPAAGLSARNVPLSTDRLRKAAGIRDGGNVHIFAVALAGGSRHLVITVPVAI